MGNTEAVLEFLETRAPDAICDDCISYATKVEPRQQVNQIARRLAGRGLLQRQQRRCADCGGIKKCNVFAEGSPPVPMMRIAEAAVTCAARPLELRPPAPDVREMRDHIVRFCRGVAAKALSSLPDAGPTRLISELREAEVVPPHQANMMLTICGLRNSYSYDKIQFGPHEVAVARAAWAIIEAWAVEHHQELWRLTTR